MREAARMLYDVFARLSDPGVSAALIAQLDARIAAGIGPAQPHLLRANLLRRCGALAQARTSFDEHQRETAGDSALAARDSDALCPPGLQSGTGHTIAPLIVIDDFLPLAEMAALHAHACVLEPHFFDARTMAEEAIYDPEKRRTLVCPQFTEKRQFFLDFLDGNLARFQRALGLPAFAIERVEIKLTNHVEGGFFKAHADNHAPVGEAGRAITWLYYFGAQPARYSGGELIVIDTQLETAAISPAWFTRVEAIPNRLVAFPSWFYHAVGPTHVPGNTFADGRFAMSSHVRKPDDGLGWIAA